MKYVELTSPHDAKILAKAVSEDTGQTEEEVLSIIGQSINDLFKALKSVDEKGE